MKTEKKEVKGELNMLFSLLRSHMGANYNQRFELLCHGCLRCKSAQMFLQLQGPPAQSSFCFLARSGGDICVRRLPHTPNTQLIPPPPEGRLVLVKMHTTQSL